MALGRDVLGAYLLTVDLDAKLRQGDLIRRNSGTESEEEWGFVLTADCDIAQGKAGDHLTYIEIVPAAYYLERAWAPAQLRRFSEKQAKFATEQLNSVMKKSGLDLTLTPEKLIKWVSDTHPDRIEKIANKTGRPLESRCRSSLDALHSIFDTSRNSLNMERLFDARLKMGEKPEKFRQSVKEAFEGDRGFPDFFLLPELPSKDGYGFVVMLRSIRSIDARHLYHSSVDAKVAGYPDAFWRAGRLDDGVRFAITQKLAFLFSRIGMPQHYEDECHFAVELMAGEIFSDEK